MRVRLPALLAEHAATPPLNYNSNWSPFRKDGWALFDKLIGHGIDSVAGDTANG